jgi:REP element-mobilizing transposase RayT
MKYDPDIHHRHSIRLKDFDYSHPGAYFVTFITHDRSNFFGDMGDDCVNLNHIGNLVQNEWRLLQKRFPGVEIDDFVVMPNHIHGIIVITAAESKQTLGSIVGSFKSSTSRLINALQKTKGNPVWQRNYYEHVIRDEEDLSRIRDYITNNPATWNEDDENQRR